MGFGLRPHFCHSYASERRLLAVCREGAVQLVFRAFSEGIDPHVAVDSVYPWEKASSESSYDALKSPVLFPS